MWCFMYSVVMFVYSAGGGADDIGYAVVYVLYAVVQAVVVCEMMDVAHAVVQAVMVYVMVVHVLV